MNSNTSARNGEPGPPESQEWISQEFYNFLGHNVLVLSNSSELGEQVRLLYRSFHRASITEASPDLTLSILLGRSRAGHNTRSHHYVYRDHFFVKRTKSYWRLFREIEVQLALFLVKRVKNRFLLHAGAVSKDEAGIILPGESKSGKSSLTLSLLLLGYRYMSDELAVVDEHSGRLHAFPKPLSIKDPSVFRSLASVKDLWIGPELGKHGRHNSVWYLHANDISIAGVGNPVPIRYIIFPQYDPTTNPRLEPLTRDHALRNLIENSINLSSFEGESLRVMRKMVEGAECFSLISNDLEDSAELIAKVSTN